MTFTCPSILSSSSLSLTLIPMLDWFIHPYLVQPVFISALSCMPVRHFLISSDLPTPNSSCPGLCQTFVALSGLSLFFIVCPYYVQTFLPCPAWPYGYLVQSVFTLSSLSLIGLACLFPALLTMPSLALLCTEDFASFPNIK